MFIIYLALSAREDNNDDQDEGRAEASLTHNPAGLCLGWGVYHIPKNTEVASNKPRKSFLIMAHQYSDLIAKNDQVGAPILSERLLPNLQQALNKLSISCQQAVNIPGILRKRLQ